MIYVLDTTAVSDLIDDHKQVESHFEARRRRGDQVILCPPVRYEVERGLLGGNRLKKLRAFHSIIVPRLSSVGLTGADWEQAVQFWVQATRKGRQLSDMDILIAAIAHRLNAVIVSSDTDFDALPVQRDNWRNPQP